VIEECGVSGVVNGVPGVSGASGLLNDWRSEWIEWSGSGVMSGVCGVI
jgi:hypothetical protein